ILLTGDTVREGLQEVIDYAPHVWLALPGVDRFPSQYSILHNAHFVLCARFSSREKLADPCGFDKIDRVREGLGNNASN
ncbi:hypothetical protein, partial [Rhizobium johnstonii]|uniref:hypothetical protein n=1 Tax=Rhizobium johnstonii TaxID=3019933 RepID=UPI003F9B871B